MYIIYRAMRADPRINFHHDWKMVTIIIGHNDACTHFCNATMGVSAWEDGSPRGCVLQYNVQSTQTI
jgi:hypothetical protein